jgi:hypothetical protein
MLRRTGWLCRAGGRRMKRAIWHSLQTDHTARTKRVGESIEAELQGGDVQEAYRHLKGWYRAATEVEARPCLQTMERQTTERVALFARRTSPGEPLPINIPPIPLPYGAPTDSELRVAAGELSNGRSGGASKMRAEHVKEWLQGVQREEDPKQPGYEGAGDPWRLLMTAVWETGMIQQQLGWIIVVLIPKGGGDYRGIGLLEPIWKIIERVMDRRLNAIPIHESLHGCRDGCGTGMAVIEAKLAQQLAHLEQRSFYGVFLDLKKAFDMMDRERGQTCVGLSAISGMKPRWLAVRRGITARLLRPAAVLPRAARYLRNSLTFWWMLAQGSG